MQLLSIFLSLGILVIFLKNSDRRLFGMNDVGHISSKKLTTIGFNYSLGAAAACNSVRVEIKTNSAAMIQSDTREISR